MEPIGTGACANVCSEVAKGIFHEAKRHIRYVTRHKKYVENFEKKLKELNAERSTVEEAVGVAERNGEKIYANVLTWRDTVEKAITEGEKEKKKAEDLQVNANNNSCFVGCCSNIKSRYQLSRRAEEGATSLDWLITGSKFDHGIGYRDVPQLMVAKDFESFKSREKVFNEIMESLKDSSTSIIGVYGMAGVGKTSLVKEVDRQLQEAKFFDSVITVTVSRVPDIQKIQGQIAESLGLNFIDNSQVVRARRLCERLKNEKKVLIILDDIWKKLDLVEVGIPFGSQHKGCKILLTSRNQNVLSNDMEATKTFPIGDLDEEEAWEFFRMMIGENFESDLELRSIAIEVAKKCACLPLAIATVARALRNKPSIYVWRNALQQLQRPSSSGFSGSEISAEVYSAIELSFNHLPSEDLKQIFLLCSLLRRYSSIEYLLRYALGLGLFDGVRLSTVRQARDRLLTMISTLKESCLLIPSDTSDESFDVHDLTYIVARSIASKDNLVFALIDEDVLIDWPDEESMRKCNKIYLLSSRINNLPDQLNCPQLSFFYLDDSSLTLQADFFKEATNIKVLDLTRMHFSSLPSSMSLLTSLTTLCLDQGKLGDNITIIGGLKNLEILTFYKSDIRILPKEIGELVKLKLLDLRHCTKLKTITHGVLSSLSRLEELYMGNTSIEWEVERAGNEQSSASLAELNKLSHLSSLEVQIPDAKATPQEFFQKLEKLDRYKIFIGREWEWVGSYKYSRALKLSLSTRIDYLDRGIKKLLRKTEDLYLDEMKSVKIALEELIDEESLSHLKKLHIQNGLDIEYITNDINEFPQLQSLTLQDLTQLISFCPQIETDATSLPHQHELPLFSEKISLPCLEKLELSSINVTRIWPNQISNSSFCTTYEKLTTLKIDKCGNLKHLLSLSMAKRLVNLTDFEIIGCNSLTEIIFAEDIEKEEIQATTLSLFPQLKSLVLRDLTQLIGFLSNFQTDQVVVFSVMKSLKIDNCPEMEGFICRSSMELEGSQAMSREVLFDSKVAFPSLEILYISYLRKMRMIWENSLLGNSFSKLQRLEVERCDELLTIFPSNNILAAFQGLQVLFVSTCASLEAVFEVESLNPHEEKDTAPPLVFLQLRELYIDHLPKLKYIWKNDPEGIFSFKSLRGMNVWLCWGLKYVFPASIARELPELSNLHIHYCGVEEIVSETEQGSKTVTFKFDQLSSLMLCCLSSCKYFYQGKHTTKWPMLKELDIHRCGKMKIFGTQLLSNNGQVESSIHPPLFLVEKVIPKLQCLKLGSDYIGMISDDQFPSTLFHEIKAFTVQNHFAEPFSFHISLLERFNTIENLSINNCEIKELFDTEGDTNNKGTHVGTLSTVRNLEVGNVQSLKSYLWKQDIRVDNILPHLETLKVCECDSLTSLGSSSALFQNLATLDVWKCEGMRHLDTCLAIKGLAQLKKLVIRNCISMKEVVASEGDEASCGIIFNRLKSLQLVDLPQLESFCSGNHAFGFPCLEDMIVSGCPMLEIFCKGDFQAPLLQTVEDGSGKGHWRGDDLNSSIQHLHSTKVGFQGIGSFVLSEFSKSIERWKEGSVDFKRLEVLKVDGCNSLKYIFSASMALDLVQLERIEVKKCCMMEQIIKQGAEETAIDTIMLPKLWKLRMESCPKLTCFCLGSVTLNCPHLVAMEVEDCQKMYAMVSAEDVGVEKTPFFNDKVLCGNLVRLDLSSTNIQKLWPDKPHTAISSNVQCLMDLRVKGCHNLEYLFPSFLIKEMAQFGVLVLSNCDSMEHVIFTDGLAATAEEDEIYLFPTLNYLDLSKLPKLGTFCHGDNSETDHAPSLFNHKVAFPSLNTLIIQHMGKVRKIWQNNVTMGSFYELTNLRVKCCERLSNILPFNLVERLEKLETLQIWECESVEEIIRPDDDDDSHTVTSTESIELKSTTKFVFPKISFLCLHDLPKLKAFYSKVHTTEWPSLKQILVSRCNKIETFAGEYINFGETQGESQRLISFQQPLFQVTEETFPNLEEIYLIENGDMKEIWHGAHPKQYFCKPRFLMFIGFPRASVNTVPDCFIRSITNREKLSVEETTFNELFPSEGDENAGTLAHSKQLSKKEPSLAQVLCNLEILPVGECGKLKNSVQSFVSFEHLTTLEVRRCHGFRYLVTLTIAKSMVQLKRMKVSDCQMLEEIVASTIGEVMDVLVFKQLESLELDRLPSLSSFCSETCTLIFPTLKEVIMRQCPKMKFFTEGNTSTPMLHGVQSTKGEYVGHWEGNLNAIIQQLFVEKVFPSMEDLEISSINMQRVWNHKLSAIHTYAQNLTCLTIEGCHSLSCLFSSEMVKCFVQLKKLNIENCENVEHVIFVEGLSKEKMNQKLFCVLESLSLKDLPKLKRFCHGNYFEFPLLTSLSIESCPALKSLVSNAQQNYSEIATPALFDERVAFPCMQKLTIEGVETGKTYGRSNQLPAMSKF